MTEPDKWIIKVECPKCGVTQPDHDGFGVLQCVVCGWCSHAAQTKQGEEWVCDICGDPVRARQSQP